MSELRPTRRRLLVAALGACGGAALLPLLSGCSDEPERPDPVDLVVRKAAARERKMLARYAATVARHPSLTEQLTVPRANHEAHLVALVGNKARARRSPANDRAEPTPRPGSRMTGSVPPVPASPDDALADLVRAERAASHKALADLLAVPPRLRRLLASVGGAEASHAALLASGGAR